MRIYEHKPIEVIRVSIHKQGEPVKYLTLADTDMSEVKLTLMDIINDQKLSVFAGGKVTSINIRHAVGSKNGKSDSISFRGLSTQEVYDLIVKHINK